MMIKLLEKLKEGKNYIKIEFMIAGGHHYGVVCLDSGNLYYHTFQVWGGKRIKFRPGSRMYKRFISGSATYADSLVNRETLALLIGSYSGGLIKKIELLDLGYL